MIYILLNNNVKLNKIDKIADGNPGIGGTQYLILLLFYYLSIHYKGKCKLITTCESLKDNNIINITKLDDVFDVIKNNSGKLIFVPNEIKESSFYKKIEDYNIYSIAWIHNYINYKLMDILTFNKSIKDIVFVGKEQYESYIDSNFFNKSCYIFNMISDEKVNVDSSQKENIVTYVGAIIPAKGFHMLAKVWKKVIKSVPDAKLQVIGGGKLYSDKSELGKYGIASQKYENKFIKYITDKNGNILDSINFLGVLGSNKSEFISKSKIGVANPTGISETFCLSAVEFKKYGIPIVTYKGYGLLDTVRNNKDGILVKNSWQLKRAIVKLLKNDKLNNEFKNNELIDGYQKFLPDKIVPQWIELIDNGKKNINTNNIYYNCFNDFKWIKILNLKLKKSLHLKNKGLSYRISFFKECIKERIKKL